ncbi:MAG: hypothetical protein E7269_04775 [Lachnospiraceae bacterium]|nr:hypothetical protein [Lachnospiraceae bacterium]
MGFLTDYEENYVEYEGGKVELDLSYDSVLNAKRVFGDDNLDNSMKILTALEILVCSKKILARLTWQEKQQLLETIFEEKIASKERVSTKPSAVPLLDFELDGEYIYASFLQDYQLDLIDAQGKLSWKRFLALMQGLSDKTKMKEVINIRAMELPEPNGRNGKIRQNIMELKSHYALPVRGGGGKDGLDRLFDTLEAQAIRR